MDWKTLFFSADGRISRQSFWIGALILIGAGVVLSWIPLINLIAGLVSIYCWICLYAKRLHDFGKSGWLAAVPVVLVVLMMLVGVGSFAGIAAMGALSGNEQTTANAMLGGAGVLVSMMGLVSLICLGFLLWVGLTPSEAGANQYGEPAANSPLPAG